MSEARFANVAGALLVGGASSRMGADKSHMEIGGEAAAVRGATLLSRLCEDVLLVGGDPPAAAPGRRVPDPDGPVCALRGVVGALAAAKAERVLLVATDLPLLPAELLLALIAFPEADAVIPRTDDGAHPLCALYQREVGLRIARQHLAAHTLALREWTARMEVRYLEGADLVAVDPTGQALTNVNTPEELARVRGAADGLGAS